MEKSILYIDLVLDGEYEILAIEVTLIKLSCSDLLVGLSEFLGIDNCEGVIL